MLVLLAAAAAAVVHHHWCEHSNGVFVGEAGQNTRGRTVVLSVMCEDLISQFGDRSKDGATPVGR